VAFIEVVVTIETIAGVPLNLTVLLEGVFVSKLVPMTVTTVPTVPVVGVKLVIVGATAADVIVRLLLAGRRCGAEAVSVRAPAVAPMTLTLTVLWPLGIRIDAGRVTLPGPLCVNVISKPPVSAASADVTVIVRVSPTRSVGAAGVSASAAGVSIVSVVLSPIVVLPIILLAVIVALPAFTPSATPFAVMDARVRSDDDHVTLLVTFCVVVSVKVPVAVNSWVSPIPIVGVTGSISRETSSAGVIVTWAVAWLPLIAAVIVALPSPRASTGKSAPVSPAPTVTDAGTLASSRYY
jgi:hypothetical protein